LTVAGSSSCIIETKQPDIDGQDLNLVFLHTSDIHSRLIPYQMDVGLTDQNLGLLPDNAPFGGIARLSAVVRQERRDHLRMAYIDSGDVFQGAPIFNTFMGEPEFKALSQMGVDAFAIGNHEFDNGATALVGKAIQYANFPMLGANYILGDYRQAGIVPTGRIAAPYVILNLGGLRVGVIGLAAMGGMYGGNSKGIVPLQTKEVVQSYVDLLRPVVDLVAVTTHTGYHEDIEYIPRTEGLDIVFGGHLHIALDPPNIIQDCDIAKLERERDLYRCDTPIKVQQRQRACLAQKGCIWDANNKLLSCGGDCPEDPACTVEHDKCVKACAAGDTACQKTCQTKMLICQCDLACVEQVHKACLREADIGRYQEKLAELDQDIAFLRKRGCHPRDVLLVHSGAFLKYVGRLQATVRQCHYMKEKDVCAEWDANHKCVRTVPRRCVGNSDVTNDWEIISHKYELIPIDKNLPEDPQMLLLMEPYILGLYRSQMLTQAIGFTPERIRRFSSGAGDSALGNLVTDAMLARNQVWADFSVTNSLGIRSDIVGGTVDAEQMNNVFPFENSITVMYLSGFEVQEMMDFIAQRSASRGCQSQAQIAGITATLNCGGCSGTGGNACVQQSYDGEACAQRVTIGGSGRPCASDKDCEQDAKGKISGEICTGQAHPDPAQGNKKRCWMPISCTRSYRLATNDYVAHGGSGFTVLGRNTTQKNLGIPLRDAAKDYIGDMPPCSRVPPTYKEKLSNAAFSYVVGQAEQTLLRAMEQKANAGDAAGAHLDYHELFYCKKAGECKHDEKNCCVPNPDKKKCTPDKACCKPKGECLAGVLKKDPKIRCTIICKDVPDSLSSRMAKAKGNVSTGYYNYMVCANAVPDSKGNCLGLGCRQKAECTTHQAKDRPKCEALARVRSALRCVTLPCIQAWEDGRIQRIFKDSSGSPNPFEPWPEM